MTRTVTHTQRDRRAVCSSGSSNVSSSGNDTSATATSSSSSTTTTTLRSRHDAHTTSASTRAAQQQQQQPLLLTCALWYAQQLPHVEHTAIASVLTAEYLSHCARARGRVAEAQLWSLVDDVLRDAARMAHCDARAIANLAQLPPHRRWYVSHFAHVQYVLQTHTLTRRANVVCCWLEAVQRQTLSRSATAPLCADDKALLRQVLFAHVRAGQLQHAVATAQRCGESVYSCVLSATQLQTVREAWFAHTALVPLFGEYGGSLVDDVAATTTTTTTASLSASWCGNEHRLDSLSQLYTESLRGDVRNNNNNNNSCDTLDALIAAALCGNLDVLEHAYATTATADWRDVVWAYLRCALVLTFTRTLMDARHVVDGGYGAYVQRMTSHDAKSSSSNDDNTSSSGDWADAFMRRVVCALTRRLRADYLQHGTATQQQQRTPLCLVDELQLRFVLHLLNSEGGSGGDDATEWFAIAPSLLQLPSTSRARHARCICCCRDNSHSGSSGDDNAAEDEHVEAVRVVTHMMLVLDAAYRDTLLTHAVQVHAAHVLARAMTCYADALAQCACYCNSSNKANGSILATTLTPEDGLHALLAMARRLCEPTHRAAVYAAYLCRARVCALDAQRRTAGDDCATTSASAAAAVAVVAVEEQEARLVRVLVDADGADDVCAEVQRRLHNTATTTTSSLSALTTRSDCTSPSQQQQQQQQLCGSHGADDALPLLTHSPAAEEVLWGAMHARDAAERVAVVRRGLLVCLQCWLSVCACSSNSNNNDNDHDVDKSTALDVIADVSAILARRVLPHLSTMTSADANTMTTADAQHALDDEHNNNNNDNDDDDVTAQRLTTYEFSETAFWQLFTELRHAAREHARVAGELAAARATTTTTTMSTSNSVSRTLLFQLAQDEARRLRRLQLLTRRAVRHGGALVHRARACVTAVVCVVQQCVDAVALSLLCADATPTCELGALQRAMRLIEEMDTAGYLHPTLLPQPCAAALYARVRAMRVAYGFRTHTRHVQGEQQQRQQCAADITSFAA